MDALSCRAFIIVLNMMQHMHNGDVMIALSALKRKITSNHTLERLIYPNGRLRSTRVDKRRPQMAEKPNNAASIRWPKFFISGRAELRSKSETVTGKSLEFFSRLDIQVLHFGSGWVEIQVQVRNRHLEVSIIL